MLWALTHRPPVGAKAGKEKKKMKKKTEGKLTCYYPKASVLTIAVVFPQREGDSLNFERRGNAIKVNGRWKGHRAAIRYAKRNLHLTWNPMEGVRSASPEDIAALNGYS